MKNNAAVIAAVGYLFEPLAVYRAVKEWTSTSAWTKDYPRASLDFGVDLNPDQVG